jgi:hypothetical protein
MNGRNLPSTNDTTIKKNNEFEWDAPSVSINTDGTVCG